MDRGLNPKGTSMVPETPADRRLSAEEVRNWRIKCYEAAVEHARRKDDYRRRVLAHPDLAARLTERPLAFKHPWQWTGYIAPQWLADETDAPTGWHLNQSPYRAQLMDIMTAVVERERAVAID